MYSARARINGLRQVTHVAQQHSRGRRCLASQTLITCVVLYSLTARSKPQLKLEVPHKLVKTEGIHIHFARKTILVTPSRADEQCDTTETPWGSCRSVKLTIQALHRIAPCPSPLCTSADKSCELLRYQTPK